MAWLRIDDRVRTHPKILQAGPVASWLWLASVCYCREHLTDGRIDKKVLPSLVPGLRGLKRETAQLVLVGLWHDRETHIEIHDFLEWNPSRIDVEDGRELGRKRKAMYSDQDLVSAIRARDMDVCRYCERPVNWHDRRGPNGGQYDHVIPRGDTTLENIVTACRGCNIRKSNRTPEQAGMPLLPARGLEPNQTPTQPRPSSESIQGPSSESGSQSSSSSRAYAGARARAISGSVPSEDQSDRFSQTTIHRRRHPDLMTYGPVELWASQFAQLVAMAAPAFGGDRDKADGAVRTWVASIDDELTEGGATAEAIKQPRKFWQDRAADQFGRKAPAATSCRRGHQPPCVDEPTCTRRYIAELRTPEVANG